MSRQTTTIVRDAAPLYDAARALHGYFLYTWFAHFLSVVLGNLRNWRNAGLLDADGRPSPVFRRVLLDFNAFDLEKLAYLCGIYFYVESSHKKANFHLLRNTPTKRVLYLRGFDFEAAVAASGTLAVGVSTLDTFQFNNRLGDLLGDEFCVFKALSPKDLYWETIGPQRHFYGDYGAIIRASSTPIRSVFLNARHWRDDIAQLAARMDYFVVYVSSLTESVLWELQHLVAAGYAERTTVVFDREAILTKNLHADLYQALPGLRVGTLLWLPKKKASTAEDIDALRAELEKAFIVVAEEDFDAQAPALIARIRAASGPLPPGARETWLPFRFEPALDDATLDGLRAVDAALWAEIDPQAGAPIDCLPLRINQVLLRVFTALLFGAHREAGCALAVYAGIMQAALDFYTTAGHINERVPAEDTPKYLALLRDHHATAADIAWSFLCSGQSHEFGDYTAAARADYDRLFDASLSAATRFLDATAHPAAGTEAVASLTPPSGPTPAAPAAPPPARGPARRRHRRG